LLICGTDTRERFRSFRNSTARERGEFSLGGKSDTLHSAHVPVNVRASRLLVVGAVFLIAITFAAPVPTAAQTQPRAPFRVCIDPATPARIMMGVNF
jgi:hypothetical protein